VNKLFSQLSRNIRVTVSREIVLDPYDKTTEIIELTPILIRAMVSDLIFSQIQWKMPGIQASQAKEIIVQKKYRALLELSSRITINNEDYYGWRVNDKMQMREEDQYLRVYIYKKQV